MAPNPPSRPEPPYEILFFTENEGDDGPVWKWLTGLEGTALRAAEVALSEVLAYRGTHVCQSEWGKALGQGLYELRIRRPAKQILTLVGLPAEDEPDSGEKLLLRIFFHPYGAKLIVLLGGYDKLERPSERHQQEQIELARKRLKIWKKLHPG